MQNYQRSGGTEIYQHHTPSPSCLHTHGHTSVQTSLPPLCLPDRWKGGVVGAQRFFLFLQIKLEIEKEWEGRGNSGHSYSHLFSCHWVPGLC